MTDVARFLKGAGDRRPSKTVYLSPDPDRLSAAEVAARAARGEQVTGSLADPAPDVEQARTAALESAWAFTVSTVAASHWEWLLARHAPTQAQREAARQVGQTLRFDPETFPQVATAACLRKATNPDGDTLTFDPPAWDADGDLVVDGDAAELVGMCWETFPLGDTTLLWTAVLELNGTGGTSGRIQSFANGSPKTRSGGR